MQQNIDFNSNQLININPIEQAQASALMRDNNLHEFNPILVEKVDDLLRPVLALLENIKIKDPTGFAEFENKKNQLLKTIDRMHDLRFSNASVSDEMLITQYNNIIESMLKQEFRELNAVIDQVCKLLHDDLRNMFKERIDEESAYGRTRRAAGGRESARALDKLVMWTGRAIWDLIKEGFRNKTPIAASASASTTSIPSKGGHVPSIGGAPKNAPGAPKANPIPRPSLQSATSSAETAGNNVARPQTQNIDYSTINKELGAARKASFERQGTLSVQGAQSAQGSVTLTGTYPRTPSIQSLNSLHSASHMSGSVHTVAQQAAASSSRVGGYMVQALITLGAVVLATYGGYRGMKSANEGALEKAREEVVNALALSYQTMEVQQELLPQTSISTLMSNAHAHVYAKITALINIFKPIIDQYNAINGEVVVQIGENLKLRGAALSKNTDLLPLYLKESALAISKLFAPINTTVQGIRDIQKSLESLREDVIISSELHPQAEALTIKLLDLKKLSGNIYENLNSMNERLDPSAKALLGIQVSIQRSVDAMSKSFNSPSSLTPADIESTLRSLHSLTESLRDAKDMCEASRNTHCANLVKKLVEKINDVKTEITNYKDQSKSNFNILGLDGKSSNSQLSSSDSNPKPQNNTLDKNLEQSRGKSISRQ